MVCENLLKTLYIEKTAHTDEADEKKKLKALGNKARVIALKTAKTAKKMDMKKLLKKAEDKKTFDVHENMSVNDICNLTGAPRDTLLDVVLSHVRIKNIINDFPSN